MLLVPTSLTSVFPLSFPSFCRCPEAAYRLKSFPLSLNLSSLAERIGAWFFKKTKAFKFLLFYLQYEYLRVINRKSTKKH